MGLADFVRARRKWVIVPILLFLAGLGLVLASSNGSALAPFIYSVF